MGLIWRYISGTELPVSEVGGKWVGMGIRRKWPSPTKECVSRQLPLSSHFLPTSSCFSSEESTSDNEQEPQDLSEPSDQPQPLKTSVVDPKLFFSYSDPTFHKISDMDPAPDPT